MSAHLLPGTSAGWVELTLITVYFLALITVLLIDPKGLADAKALRNAPAPDPTTRIPDEEVTR